MANLTVSTDIDAFMGSADKAAGRSNLGAAASGPNTDITSVALTSGTIVGPPSGDNAIVNKAYADSISSGINFHDACLYATTAALPAYTYDNGPLNDGVGASITATANGSFSPDNVAIAVTVPAQRILVKNETAAFAPYNGIYTVERAGGASETFKLVRATDYDTSGSGTNEIQAGDFILISGGDTLRNTAWIQQSALPIDVGVDPLSFVQFSAPISGVVSVNQGGTGQQSFTNGQLLIGNTTGNTLAKATLTAGTGMTVTNGSGAITLTAKGLGTQVKVVGVDGDGTIQSCINLCTGASSTNPFTVLIPPKAGNYVEALTLKGSVALIGLTNALNSDAIQIEGSHTYAPDLASSNSNRIGFENLTFISASLTDNTISVVAGTGGTKYASQLRFSGCVFSGGKNSGVSHISTCDNVSLYIDNSRFESSTGNSGSVGITQGNGPLYINNNTVFDVFGKALDIPASTTVTKTATSTFGSHTLTVSDVTGLSVGQKISGTGLYSTTTVVSITAPSTVVMSTPPQTVAAGFTATFGQTPYVEIRDSVLAGKGAEVVRLGNGLLTCNTSNFTNTATLASNGLAGNGINLRVAGTIAGIVNSSFTIYDTSAYTVTTEATGSLPANAAYAALNGVSYSNIAGAAFSTLTGANVIVLDYTARATSIENGGTGQITRQAALNALAGAVTPARVLAGDGTNITLRALAAADIPSLAASKITSGQLAVAQGGTGASSLTGIVKGTGTTAMVAATSGTDYVAGADVSSYRVTAVLDTSLSLSGATKAETKITFASGPQTDIDSHVLAAGDIIFLAASITSPNSTAYKGPWVITTAGATGIAAVWDRPAWWTTNTARSGVLFSVNQGSTYQGSVWTIYPTAGADALINVGFTGLTALNLALKGGLPTANLTGTVAVANGGTGTTTSTGTGAVVLGTVPTLSGYTENVTALGTVSAASTLSLAASNFQTATLTSATPCTFTMPTATAGKTFVLLLKQPATGTFTTATFTGVKWPSSVAPVITATLGRMDILQFRADGASWYGNVLGQNYTY